LESNLGQSYVAAGEYDDALTHLGRALASKRARVPAGASVPPPTPPSGDERSSHIAAAASVPIGFAYALGNQGFAHGDMGDYARCEAEMEAALEVLRGTGHAIEASRRIAWKRSTRCASPSWAGSGAGKPCAHAQEQCSSMPAVVGTLAPLDLGLRRHRTGVSRYDTRGQLWTYSRTCCR